MKYIKLILPFMLVVTICSCNFYTSTKASVSMKKVLEKPEQIALVGHWMIDSFSYKLINKHYDLGQKKISLNILENGSLNLVNIPDLTTLDEKKSYNSNVVDVTGKWELFQYKEGGQWFLDFDIKRNLGLNNSLHLYIKDGKLVLVNYIGDPDEGNRLLFEKTQ